MPAVKPFAGYRYDTARVDLSAVVAPPYDVIGQALREELYARDPRNIVRLILSRESDPYGSAAASLDEWVREGFLVRDDRPSLYLVDQEFFLPGGERRRRSGFIAACMLEDFGGSVLPHEKTHSAPREDRLRLMRATGMMFSQIFALYADPGGTLRRTLDRSETLPALTAVHDGVVATMRVCRDERAYLAVSEFLRESTVLIADGHHRYETALAYRNEMRLQNPGHRGAEPYNFVPMFFTDLHDPGTVMLPTHRLLHGLAGFERRTFLEKAGAFFSVEPVSPGDSLPERVEASEGAVLGVAFPGGESYLLRPGEPARRALSHLPAVVSRLDVSFLHGVVFGRILEMTEASQESKRNLEYERDAQEAMRMLARNGSHQAAFLMKAPPVEQVKAAAEAGMTLPQKTTYFFPKLLSGLVSYPCREDRAG